jgi:L-ascorbate peroxidase
MVALFISMYRFQIQMMPSSFVLQDEDTFFKDYAESHKKLSELGFTPRSGGPASTKPELPTAVVLAQSAVGVAVAAAVVIAGYLYEASKRSK